MSFITQRVAGIASAFIFSLGVAVGASAATLDFTTSTYDSTFGFTPGDNVTTDSVGGVNFTVTATSFGSWGFRQGGGGGLNFGRSGNGMTTVSIVADQDVTFTSMYGRGHGLTSHAGQMPFNVSVDGTDVSVGNAFASTTLETVNFASGPIALAAGEVFLFYSDYSSLIGDPLYASGLVKSFDFDLANSVSPVPLPAGLPLLFGALGILGFVRIHESSERFAG